MTEVALTVVIKGQDIDTEGKTSDTIRFTDTTMELGVDPAEMDGNSAKTGIWLYAQLRDVFGERRYTFEDEPFLDCEGDPNQFHIESVERTSFWPIFIGEHGLLPFINCLNTEDCDIPIRAGDDWAASISHNDRCVGNRNRKLWDFKAGEALIESTLEDFRLKTST